MKRRSVDIIRVFSSPGNPARGRVRAGPLDLPCALGRSGVSARKREGDGATPIGRMQIAAAWFRAGRMRRPWTLLPARPLRLDDGWCDDPGSRLYNRPVRLPIRAGHERMWRDDQLYDIVVDLGWNRSPAVRRRGSAIFLHVARPGYGPTEGCVAVDRRHIARLLARIAPAAVMVIGACARPRRPARG